MLLHDQDPKGRRPEDAEEDESANDTMPLNDDGSPILDEEDLEENDLSDEEAEDVEWEGEEGRSHHFQKTGI